MQETTKTLPDIRQQVVIDGPIEKVWDAVATAGGLAAWFMPNDMQPEEGRAFQLNAGHWGISQCRVTAVERPHRFAFAWGEAWHITILLVARDAQTEVTLIHSGWQDGGITEHGEPHSVVRERMNGGWGGLMQALRRYVEGM